MDNSLIKRQDAIDATWFEPSYTDPLNLLTEVRDRLKVLPSAQPDITLESAIDYLQSIGWMQEHDRIMSASAQPDLFGYSDRLWKSAYDCGYDRCKQDAIEEIENIGVLDGYTDKLALLDKIRDLHTAQPEKSTTDEKSQLSEEKSTRKLIYLDDAVEAIEMLLEQSEDDMLDTTWNNAIRGAINAVKHHVPSAQLENTCENTCDFARMSNGKDTVYRKDMIEMIQGVPISSGTTKAMLMFRAKELPSAQPEQECEKCIFKPFKQFQPERKKGEWIPERLECTNGGMYQVYRCDQCHEAFNWKMDFCGGCGADMRGEEHETD